MDALSKNQKRKLRRKRLEAENSRGEKSPGLPTNRAAQAQSQSQAENSRGEKSPGLISQGYNSINPYASEPVPDPSHDSHLVKQMLKGGWQSSVPSVNRLLVRLVESAQSPQCAIPDLVKIANATNNIFNSVHKIRIETGSSEELSSRLDDAIERSKGFDI